MCSRIRMYNVLVGALSVLAIFIGINAAGTAAIATTETTPEPNLNEYFVWNGLVSSNVDDLPSADDDAQSAVILPLREDNGLYSGTVTFQSNSPVDVVVWNRAPDANVIAEIEDLGDISDFSVINNQTIVPIEIASGTSGSVPFIGNALEFVGGDEQPFVASYALNGIASEPEIVSDLASLGNFTDGEEEEQ